MKNKNLLIGGGVVVAGLLFFYLRKKRSESAETPLDEGTGGSGTGGSGTGGSGTPSPTPNPTPSPTSTPSPTASPNASPTPTTQLSKFEVDMRVLKSCGLAPPSFKKQARNRWDECKDKTKAELRSQGLISFNGMIEDNRSRLDFDGNIVD